MTPELRLAVLLCCDRPRRSNPLDRLWRNFVTTKFYDWTASLLLMRMCNASTLSSEESRNPLLTRRISRASPSGRTSVLPFCMYSKIESSALEAVPPLLLNTKVVSWRWKVAKAQHLLSSLQQPHASAYHDLDIMSNESSHMNQPSADQLQQGVSYIARS
jgi:hypothetical protein